MGAVYNMPYLHHSNPLATPWGIAGRSRRGDPEPTTGRMCKVILWVHKRCKGVAERYGPLCSWVALVPIGTGCNWVAVPPWHRCNEGCIGMHMRPMCLRAHRAQAQLSIPGVLVLCARTWSEWLRILGQIPPGQTPGEYCTLHGLPPHFSLILL